METTTLDPRLMNLDPRVQRMVIMLGEATHGDRTAQRVLRTAAFDHRFSQEALTTSDFPGLFQRAVNAQVLARYTQTPTLWPAWAKRITVKGLKKQDFIDLMADISNLPKENGGARTYPGGLPRIPEGTPFPAIAMKGSETSIWTYKIGARLAFTWEAFDNDDWNMIAQLPDALVHHAVRTEDLSATAALWDENGFRSDVFTIGGSAGDNPPLSWTSLSAAKAKASQMSDPERVNTITQWALIVPRELEDLANAIVSTQQIEQTDSAGNKLIVNNRIGSSIKVVVNPFIGVIANKSTYNATGWCLVPANGNGSDRTSVAQVFKQGDETPELRIKNDQGQALGGGAIGPWEGSFDSDDIQVRVRHFTNTMVTDGEHVGFYASKGTDS